ncbi:MAG TPA: NADH-quinone oxidoreductase subunit D, partial [Firmicutes bacterium]|nr:NADH-quinone oxidoreductase subunit D [Bacillota bacterium]
MGERRTVIPFGPQHPVLPEPIQLKLVIEDEKVVEALPQIGYVHRGLERLVKVRDFHQMVFVAERICGICSFQHAMTYCLGIERLMNIEVPERADYLRVIWSELHRVHSHLLWLGLLADAFGFESLFMETWKIREA